MIFLFDDFGSSDIYVGQVKARLLHEAPDVAVVDLLHDAANYDVASAAHLLAAFSAQLPRDAVVQAVVDPGVGGERRAVALRADDRWYVAPDNGLLSVLAARARSATVYEIIWQPEVLSDSFHGRDLFAHVSAMLARGESWPGALVARPGLQVTLAASDLPRIIYIDHYGNAMTGLRGEGVPTHMGVEVAGRRLGYARVFEAAPEGAAFWYINSLGLVEIAVRRGSAVAQLGLQAGSALRVLG